MKTNYLLPNKFKKIGWILFLPSFVMGVLWLILELESGPAFLDVKVLSLLNEDIFKTSENVAIIENNIANEILGILIIIGASFIAFAKEKNEDEFISKLRLESLVRATYLNYGILIFALLFVYNLAFYTVMLVNMFTILIFFILHFNWALYKSKRGLSDEE